MASHDGPPQYYADGDPRRRRRDPGNGSGVHRNRPSAQRRQRLARPANSRTGIPRTPQREPPMHEGTSAGKYYRDRSHIPAHGKPTDAVYIPRDPRTSEYSPTRAASHNRNSDFAVSASNLDPEVPPTRYGNSTYSAPAPAAAVEWYRDGTQEVTILKNEYTAYKERVARDHLQILELKENVQGLEKENAYLNYKKRFFQGKLGDFENDFKTLQDELKEKEVVVSGLNGALQRERAKRGEMLPSIGQQGQRVVETQQMEVEVQRLNRQVEWFKDQLQRVQNGGARHPD